MRIEITGGSDDLIEVSGCEGEDEYCNPESVLVKLSGNLVAPDGAGVRINALYDNGCWSFSVGLIDEDTPWPGWDMEITEGDRPYNTLLTIDAPEGTRFIVDDKYHSTH